MNTFIMLNNCILLFIMNPGCTSLRPIGLEHVTIINTDINVT